MMWAAARTVHTGPGAGVVVSSPESAQGEVAQGFWELEGVGADCVFPAVGEPPSVYEGRCEGAVPVLDVEVAGVIIHPSDGA